MAEPDFVPPLTDPIEPAPAPVDPRSESHLALVNHYRVQFVQDARALSTVSGHLAVIAETGDPHRIFERQVAVLDTLFRALGNTLRQLQALAETKGTA